MSWEYGQFQKFGMVRVVEYYTEAGYSWAMSAVFYHPESGTYRFTGDAGCSCNGPWDFLGDDDFGPPLTATEARWAVLNDSCTSDFTIDDKNRAAAAVDEFARGIA